jgi:hypothetical protein
LFEFSSFSSHSFPVQGLLKGKHNGADFDTNIDRAYYSKSNLKTLYTFSLDQSLGFSSFPSSQWPRNPYAPGGSGFIFISTILGGTESISPANKSDNVVLSYNKASIATLETSPDFSFGASSSTSTYSDQLDCEL